MRYVVFIDVDGVLNTLTTCESTPSGNFGVDPLRVELLSKVMRECMSDGVVLTTTWKTLKPDHEDYKYLMGHFSEHGIKVLGKIEENFDVSRGEGILKYLSEHPEIKEWVILDDQSFDFEKAQSFGSISLIQSVRG